MAKNTGLLKPHLLEISSLRRILNILQEWIDMYKDLQSKEQIYIDLLLSTKDKKTIKYYVFNLKEIRKNIETIGKRINFSSLNELFTNIFKRLDYLYKIDLQNKEEEKKDIKWRTQNEYK